MDQMTVEVSYGDEPAENHYTTLQFPLALKHFSVIQLIVLI